MANIPLERLNLIASDILPGRHVETTARGEDYYVFEAAVAQGLRSPFPPVWIDPHASDQQVKYKLSREFEQAFRPDSSPDDVSVPNLQTEANQPRIAEKPARPA